MKVFFQKIRLILSKPIVKEIIVSIFIAALVSSTISYFFNKNLDRSVANREFIFNFSRAFFDNPKYRNISVALEESYLYDKGKVFKENGGAFTDYEIDDYLSLLYDLYAYGEESLVQYDIIEDQFHYYVCVTYQNKEIRDYRNRLIIQGFSEVGAHGFLDDLATKFGIDDSYDCKNL